MRGPDATVAVGRGRIPAPPRLRAPGASRPAGGEG